MGAELAKSRFEDRLTTTVSSTPALHDVQVLLHAPSRDIDWHVTVDEDGTPADPEAYHAASVGKTFTSTLIAMLVEEGRLAFDDPIEDHLPADLIDGLHVRRGVDRSRSITVHHLLSHTSGLPHLHPDEFPLLRRRPDRGPDGMTFFDHMLAESERFIEPAETIAWTADNLTPHFAPGEGIHDSEIGYNLLGLLIESVTGQRYHEVLHDRLFDPLGMDNSYLAQYSTPAVASDRRVAPMYIGEDRYDVDEDRSFSAWFAGGQTVNTARDLLTFHRALVEGRLVDPETLTVMQRWQRLGMGIDYGYGLVRFRPLPMLARYRAWGGLGASSAFMFYNPTLDLYLVGTFNQ